MTALDIGDPRPEPEHEAIPTLTELAYIVKACPPDQTAFKTSDSAHYECTFWLSEEIEYRMTASIAAMRFYDEDADVVYAGMRADDIDYESPRDGPSESALKDIETPEELIQFIVANNDALGVRINADPEGFLIVTVQEDADPNDRALETYAPIETVWRNDVQIYPPLDASQPQT